MKQIDFNIMWVLVPAFVLVFLIRLRSLLKKARKIEAEGVETDAVVSRIEVTAGTARNSSTTYIYAKFTDRDGVERECIMSMGPGQDYTEGERIRIRYIPGDYQMVRFAGR